eukprot:SAG11_NODE_1616_length_4577_cov_1.568781_4_plen_107_part_00
MLLCANRAESTLAALPHDLVLSILEKSDWCVPPIPRCLATAPSVSHGGGARYAGMRLPPWERKVSRKRRTTKRKAMVRAATAVVLVDMVALVAAAEAADCGALARR